MTAASGACYDHSVKAGDLVRLDELQLVMACRDGLISIPPSLY